MTFEPARDHRTDTPDPPCLHCGQRRAGHPDFDGFHRFQAPPPRVIEAIPVKDAVVVDAPPAA